MKINLNTEDNQKLEKLIETKEINMNIADVILTAFSYVDLLSCENIKSPITIKEITDIIFSDFKIEKNEYNLKMFDFCTDFQELNKESYVNEYVKTFSNISFKNNKYSLKKLYFEPYQLIARDEIKIVDQNYLEQTQIGYFKDRFEYLALLEGNNVWMSVNPNEINTMKPFISKAHGNVLLLGLGMGYIAYMMALKDNVKSITIIENNAEIIDIFKTQLFSKFPNKTPIKIIKSDAISYLSNNYDYDYIFADLWHTPEDGIFPFIKLQEVEKKNNIKIDYWLDVSLKAMKRRYLISLIQENLLGYKEEDYLTSKNDEDKVLNYLYKVNKDIEINSFEDLINYLEN